MKATFKVNKFMLAWTLGCLMFFRPATYIVGVQINRLLNLIQLLMCIGMVILAGMYYFRGYRMKATAFFAGLLYFWCLGGASVVSAASGRPVDWSDAGNYLSQSIAFILWCDIGLWFSPKKTLKCFLRVGILMTTLNAATFFMFFKSGGLNPNVTEIMNGKRIELTYFLLERDNATYFWAWPVLVVTWYYYYKYHNAKRFRNFALAYTALIIASYVYVWSVLAAVACIGVPMVLFVLNRMVKREMKGKKRFNLSFLRLEYLWAAAVGFDFFLTVSFTTPFIQHIIQDVFHKDATLSGRSYIWARAYRCIKQFPLFGVGCEPASESVIKLSINHTHNLFLETMYRGGIIGMVLLVVLFVLLSFQIRKSSRYSLYQYFVILLSAFLMFSSVEFAYYRYHYLILILILSHTELLRNSRTDKIIAELQDVAR